MNKDLLLINHINSLMYKRGKDQMTKLKELSIKTDKIFKEMHSYRIAQRRIKKMIKVWKKL
jgi:hypothetical protein